MTAFTLDTADAVTGPATLALDPYAELNGRDVAGLTVADHTIRYGRDADVDAQADPGSFSGVLLARTGEGTVPQVGDTLEVGYTVRVAPGAPPDLADLDGARLVRFHGQVTDAVADVHGSGSTSTQVVAVSTALGRAARRVVGDEPWPAEPAAGRVARILALAGVSATVRGPDLVAVAPRDVDRQGALALAASTASSAACVIAEHPGPDLAVEVHTAEYRRDPGPPVTIPARVILAPLTAEQRVETLCNRARVRWGPANADTAPEVLVEDLAAQDRRGVYERSVTTELATENDARLRAQRYVAVGESPAWLYGELTVDLALVDDPLLLVALLGLRIGDRVDLDVPGGLGQSATFVEGWHEALVTTPSDVPGRPGRAELLYTPHLSAVQLTVPAPRWVDVDPALTWAQVDPETSWNDAAVSVGPARRKVA